MAELVTNIREHVQPVHNPIISGISVIPDWGLGHPEPRGISCGHYSQSDVVDEYVAKLNDELDSENVRSAPINTRKRPALDQKARFAEVTTGYIPLLCSCDFYTRERTTNTSVIEFSGAHLKALAHRISEALTEWGRCSSFEHRGSMPVALNDAQAFIRIKPFSLNGPNAEDYLRRLDSLGVAIGRAIGGYFAERNILKRRR